jgi:hypothetical protein
MARGILANDLGGRGKALAHLREGDPAACVAALASTPRLAGIVAALISGGFIQAAEDALMEAGE